jgi:hypothetical protein
MDTDRRIKTVIAGTFAIGRKSLSNAQPISADETQRTKAEMTMASTHMPTLHEARAERHLRRAANQVFHSVEAVEGRHPRNWQARSRDGQGKVRVAGSPLGSAPRYLSFFLFHNPANFLAPEFFRQPCEVRP